MNCGHRKKNGRPRDYKSAKIHVMSTFSEIFAIAKRTTSLSDISIRIALWGHISIQRPHPRQASDIRARPFLRVMASTKQTFSEQRPQPAQRSVTSIWIPGIRRIFDPIIGDKTGNTLYKQQHGQQLHTVSKLFAGPVFNQIESILLRPIMWTRPRFRQCSAWSRAS